jgi:hypothetical protein
MKDKLAFAFAAATTAATLYSVPTWQGFLLDPCLWAAAIAALTIILLLVTRHLGDRARLFEVKWLALFLAGMPLIYVGRWILDGGLLAGYGALILEVAGLLFYATLAVLGLRQHWFLVAGIAAHGMGWDIWHYYPKSGYIPAWYAIGCLLVDVGLAVYAATRVPLWQRAEERLRTENGSRVPGVPAAL